MLTPMSPASANSRASSPGWSGTATNTDAVGAPGRRACRGWRGCRRRPRRAARRAPSPVAVGDRARAARRARRGTSSQQRRAARRALAVTICSHSAGSPPAIRVTSRTPCPDSARWSGGRVGQPAGDQRGQQVRQVRDAGHRPVVLLGGHPDRRRRRTARPARSTSATASGSDVVVRGDRPRPAVEEGRRRGQRAGPLAAGHRVAADVAAPALGAGVRGLGSGSPLTLPTSVTTASEAASARGPRSRRGGPGGTATTTSCGRSGRRRRDRRRGRRRCARARGERRRGAPRARRGGRPARPRCRAGRRRRPGPVRSEVTHGGHSSGTDRTRVRSRRSVAAPCR